MIQVEIGTTGEIVEFPEGTPEWEIQSAMRRIVSDSNADKTPIPYESPQRLMPPEIDVGASATDLATQFGAPPRVAGAAGAMTHALGSQFSPSMDEAEPEPLKILKDQGVVTDKPAPAGLFESGLGHTPKDRAVAMETALEKHFGKPVPVKHTDQGLQWLDPETNRWTLATKYGPDMGDLKEHAATIGQITTEVVGGIAGMPFGPKGVIAGGVAAAYVSELARLYLGKTYGTNRNMDDADIVKSALVNSGLAYVGGKLGDVLLKLTKGTINVINKLHIPQEAVDAVRLKSDDIDEVIQRVQQETDRQATPTLGKQTGDETLLRVEEMEKKSGQSMFGKEFRQRDIENRGSAEDFLEAQNREFGQTPDSSYEFGQGLSKAAEQRTQPVLDAADQRLAGVMDDAQQLESSLPSPALIQSGQQIRSGVMLAYDQFEEQAGQRYKQGLTQFAADNGIDMQSLTVPLTTTARLARTIDADIGDVEKLFPNLSQSERKVIGAADDMNPLFSGEPLTFDQYRRATSFLKKRIRLAEKQLGESPNDVATMKRLLGSMKEDYENALSRTDNQALITHMRDLDNWYNENRQIFDNDVIGEVLAKTQGDMWYVKDADVFKQVFSPGNHEVAERVSLVLSGIPDGEFAQNAIRREMLAEYRRQVFADGKPIPGKHTQFMQDYESVMRPFFSNSDWSKVQGARNLGNAIVDIEKRNERIKGQIMNTFEYKIAKEARGNDVSYHNLFSQVWGKGKVGQIQKVKEILSGDRALMNQFRSLAAKDIRDSVFGTKTVKLDTFTRYLDSHGGEIKALFGNDYYANLHVLRQYLEITQRQGRGANTSGTASALVDTLKLGWRAYMGPLSHGGFVARKVGEFSDTTQQRVLSRIILEPNTLDDLIRAATLTDKQKAAARIAGIIYMTDIDDEFINTPDLAEPVIEQGVEMMGNMFSPQQATEMMQTIPQ